MKQSYSIKSSVEMSLIFFISLVNDVKLKYVEIFLSFLLKLYKISYGESHF